LIFQLVAKWLVTGLPEPPERHINIAVAQRGDTQLANSVGRMKPAGSYAVHLSIRSSDIRHSATSGERPQLGHAIDAIWAFR